MISEKMNNSLVQNEYLEQIKLFNKKDSWKIDDMQHLKALVTENMENIAQCVCSQPGYEREALTEFVERFKTEFPNNVEGEKIASNISYHMNAFFFSHDFVKDIFSNVISASLTKRNCFGSSGLEYVSLVSKSFNAKASDAKKNLVQNEFYSLKILGLKTADEAIKYVEENHLLHINLGNFSDFSDTHLKLLAEKCLNLQKIYLGCTQVTEEGLKVLAKNCSKLRQINLCWTKVTYEGLKELTEKFLNLQKIDLCGAKVTDEGLKSLAEKCPNLQQIDLCNTGVTDDGLKQLADNCPNLEQIFFTQSKVTDEGLKRLAEKCLKLREIRGFVVSAEGLKALIGKCPKLQIICFDLITKVTDEWVKTLPEKCLNLQQIDLNCAQITNQGVKALANKFPNLEKIILSGTYATYEGILALAEGCTNLQEIELYDTEAGEVTEEEVKALAKEYPNLKIIN